MNDLAFGLSLDWPHCPAGVVLTEEMRVPPNLSGGLLGDLGRQGAEAAAAPISVAVFRAKSTERIVINRRLRNLENCMVVTFVNATREGTRRGSLAKFLSEYGFPGRGLAGADGGRGTEAAMALAQMDVDNLVWQQAALRGVLVRAGAADVVSAVGDVNEALRRYDLDEVEMWRPKGRPVPMPGLPPDPLPFAPFKLTPSLDFSPETHKPVLRLGVNSLYDFMMMECAFAALVGARAASCGHCGDLYLTGPMTGRRSTSVYCSDACRKAAARKRGESDSSPATP